MLGQGHARNSLSTLPNLEMRDVIAAEHVGKAAEQDLAESQDVNRSLGGRVFSRPRTREERFARN